jgi:hypothetical protein
MGFIVDDIAIIATIAAALAAGGSMGSLFADGASKTIRTFTNPRTGQKTKVKLDGPLKGIDQPGAIGHIIQPGPDYGKAVDKNGLLILADGPLERLGIGSYDAVKIASAMNTGLTRMLNPRGEDQLFGKTAKYGSMKDLTQTIIRDPDFMKRYMDALLKKGQNFNPETYSPQRIVEILTNPRNVAPIIASDPSKYKDILDMIREKFPNYKIEPTQPLDITQTGSGGDEPQPDKPDTEPKVDPQPKPKPPKKPDEPDGPKGPKKIKGDERDPQDPPDPPDEPEDDKKDKDKPKPLPGPADVQEKEIASRKKPTRQQTPQQWYPQYEFGGQNMLKLTDVEKIEELKNYTLFDLVNPLLEGDRNNLLAIQNRLKEKMRFSNTYANPKPEPQLPPPPANFNSAYEMRNVMPTPYPYTLDMPQANNYFDNFCYEYATELNKNLDSLKQDHCFNPEISKIMNSKRTGFTATDPQIMTHQGAKSSLLEGLDSTSIDTIDLMMLRN